MAILGHTKTLLRTMPCPVPPAARPKLRGARRASPIAPRPAGPVTVQRRVSSRGSIMVATQKIQAGMIHARKTVTVIAENDCFRLVIDGETVAAVPRTTSREVHRYKAHATQAARTRPDEGSLPLTPRTSSQDGDRDSGPA
jgi:hypothetical protein